jgi:hypothetical protein
VLLVGLSLLGLLCTVRSTVVCCPDGRFQMVGFPRSFAYRIDVDQQSEYHKKKQDDDVVATKSWIHYTTVLYCTVLYWSTVLLTRSCEVVVVE